MMGVVGSRLGKYAKRRFVWEVRSIGLVVDTKVDLLRDPRLCLNWF